MVSAIDLLILGLATWRLASLLANEGGPLDMFARLRHWLGVRYATTPPFSAYGTNVVSEGILCIWCNSVWIGTILTVAYVVIPTVVIPALPLALSALAIGYDQYVINKQ